MGSNSQKKGSLISDVDLGEDFVVSVEEGNPFEEEDLVSMGKLAEDLPFSVILEMYDLSGVDIKTYFAGRGAGPDDLTGQDFTGSGDCWDGADLRGTDLTGCVFGPDNTLNGTLMEGANLTRVTGLAAEILACAYIDESTILPEGIDRAEVERLHAAKDMPSPPRRKRETSTVVQPDPMTQRLN